MKKNKFFSLALLCGAFLVLSACNNIISETNQSLDIVSQNIESTNGDSQSIIDEDSQGLEFELTDRDTYYVSQGSSSSLTEIVIPSTYKGKTVDGIKNKGFYNCSNLKTILIPDSVTFIGESSFSGCRLLKSIVIPDSVVTISCGAFSDCYSLAKITIPFVGGSATENYFLGYIFGASKYEDNMSCVPNSLEKVIISDKCVSIYNVAFYRCNYLKSILIGNSVTSIGNSAFYGCSSLTSISIPESVTSIGDSAFQQCFSLTSITIPDSVTSIGIYAFAECLSLKTVFLGNRVTSIGQCAFSDCENLESIIIPDSVTSIGIYTFYGCTSLRSITLPFIGGSAIKNQFLGYIFGASSYSQNSTYVPASLKEVIVSNACTSIDNNAFNGCSSLESIVIPNSVTSIGNSAFYGCSSLTSITIPNSVTSIAAGAFSGCSSLTSITIPNSVTSIDKYAFSNCSSLTKVFYSGSAADWSSISIGISNTSLTSATIYYYSETEPAEPGNYWHYVDGVPTIW